MAVTLTPMDLDMIHPHNIFHMMYPVVATDPCNNPIENSRSWILAIEGTLHSASMTSIPTAAPLPTMICHGVSAHVTDTIGDVNLDALRMIRDTFSSTKWT